MGYNTCFVTDKHSSLFIKLQKHQLILLHRQWQRKKFHKIDTRAQCYKAFYSHNLQMFVISLSVLGKSFQHRQMFPSKARDYPSEAPFICSTPPGLTHKYQTRLERHARDKHNNLLRTFINYGQKSFTILTPGANIKNFFVHNLSTFLLSQSIFYTRVEKLAKDKQSSLVRIFANYRQKSFIRSTPGANVIKLFLIFVLSQSVLRLGW